MKYVSQGPLMVDVHMHKPQTNAKNFMDALLAFWPGLQVSACFFACLLIVCSYCCLLYLNITIAVQPVATCRHSPYLLKTAIVIVTLFSL